MKYPLRTQDKFVGRAPGSSLAIVDDAGQIVFSVVASDDPDARKLAEQLVEQANRWCMPLRPKPEKTREDWLFEQNTAGEAILKNGGLQ